MERREHEVTGERRLNRHIRGLAVTDFSHHHDVGILAQHGSDRGREGDVELGSDLHLVEIVVDQLDRILDGDDVHLGLRHMFQHRIEGRRLAAAGGTGDEDDAFAMLEKRHEAREVGL